MMVCCETLFIILWKINVLNCNKNILAFVLILINKVAGVTEDFVVQMLKIREHSNNKQHLVDGFPKCHINFFYVFLTLFLNVFGSKE